MQQRNAVIIGAGINGLVAANYLRRAGFGVTLLERRETVGGACVKETAVADGMTFDYPLGATVLGMMQDFVLEETGLRGRVELFEPTHPKMIRFARQAPMPIHRSAHRLQRELTSRWGERGDVRAFRRDEDRVIRYLQRGYREGRTPSLDHARTELGADTVARWITGSARELLDHYFTDERTKVYMGSTVIESGPASFHEPYSAFTVPLMDSGSVFDGYWGFVKGGIWRITEELGRIDREIGCRVETSVSLVRVDRERGTVMFVGKGGRPETHAPDAIVFATDPLTAARLSGDDRAVARMKAARFAGTSGKAMLIFRRNVRWKHHTGAKDFSSAFKFFYERETLEGLEVASQRVAEGATSYDPGYFQVYCEGAAMRRLGMRRGYDSLAVFFKNMGWTADAKEMDWVREEIVGRVLREIHNPPADLVWSRLLTPADLRERFSFPLGNIDHALVGEGQNFDGRSYAEDPTRSFYRLGGSGNIWYCGAGAYPCGSVAGTPGYMCARQLLRSFE